MKHLAFLYYTIAYSSGLPTLAIVLLAYAKIGHKIIKYYLPFLVSITLQLIFATVLQYQNANLPVPNSYANVEAKYLYFLAESSIIFTMPLFSHKLIPVRYPKQRNILFGILYLISLGIISSPYFLRYLPLQRQLTALSGFIIYRTLFFLTVTYCILLIILNIRKLTDKLLRMFATVSLLFIVISLLTWLSGCLLKPTFPNLDPKSLTPNQIKALASLERVDDHPLYVMRYYGDYSFILKFKKTYYKELGMPNPPKCTTFAALNQSSEALFGRNQDELEHPALLLFTNPPNGYASVCLANIGGNFGFDMQKKTPFKSEEARTRLLFAPYFFRME